MIADQEAGGGLRHAALLYHETSGYLAAVQRLVQDAHARAEPVFMAVPGPRSDQLRQELGRQAAAIEFADMAGLGRNPARVASALLAFSAAHPGRRAHFLVERAWRGRPAAEVREATKNEALINLALAGVQATIVCPYDAGAVRAAVIADARRSHPAVISRGAQRDSPTYQGPAFIPPAAARPLGPPPRRAASLSYETGLRPVREFVADQARRGGVDPGRIADLALGASEVAANTLRHTGRSGTVRAWRTRDEFFCQLDDSGQISDPLAGLHPPSPERHGGQGLWVVNQVCDLAEFRTGPQGTVIRMHLRLGGSPSASRLTGPSPASAEPGPGSCPGGDSRNTPWSASSSSAVA